MQSFVRVKSNFQVLLRLGLHKGFPLAQKLSPFFYSFYSDSLSTYSARAVDLSSFYPLNSTQSALTVEISTHSALKEDVSTHSALTVELPVRISTNAGLVDHVDHQLQLLAGRDAEHCKHEIKRS